MDIKRLDSLAPVTLAYVGDAVFTLFVRAALAERYDCKTGRLGGMCSKIVCASTQSALLEAIMPDLTESEADVARRCRNTHTPSKAKNASMGDYKRATALEGVIGYLYLNGQHDRLDKILNMCLSASDEILSAREPKMGRNAR